MASTIRDVLITVRKDIERHTPEQAAPLVRRLAAGGSALVRERHQSVQASDRLGAAHAEGGRREPLFEWLGRQPENRPREAAPAAAAAT
jgi:hypothetical protein